MLDQQPEELEAELPEVEQVEETVDETVEIGFTDDQPEPEPEEEPETPLIKKLRQQVSEEAKARRELAAQLAEKELVLPPEEEEPKIPSIADCDYDDAKLGAAMVKYRDDLAKWVEGKAEREKARKEKADDLIAFQTDWAQRIGNFNAQKAKLPVPDFAKVEESVKAKLTQPQLQMIIRNIEKPAEFMYALGKNEAKLNEVASIKHHDRFAAAIVRLEGKVKIDRKGPPPPESKLPTTSGQMPNGALEAARKKAEATGNYSDYLAMKRRLQSGGK